jgi:hypothetical protein
MGDSIIYFVGVLSHFHVNTVLMIHNNKPNSELYNLPIAV